MGGGREEKVPSPLSTLAFPCVSPTLVLRCSHLNGESWRVFDWLLSSKRLRLRVRSPLKGDCNRGGTKEEGAGLPGGN